MFYKSKKYFYVSNNSVLYQNKLTLSFKLKYMKTIYTNIFTFISNVVKKYEISFAFAVNISILTCIQRLHNLYEKKKNIGCDTVIPGLRITKSHCCCITRKSMQKVFLTTHRLVLPAGRKKHYRTMISTTLSPFNINLIVEFITISSINSTEIGEQKWSYSLPPITGIQPSKVFHSDQS